MAFSIQTVGEWVTRLRGYIKETQGEVGKVVWPSRQYVIAATVVVLLLVAVVSVIMMAVDFSLARVFHLLFGLLK